MSHSDSNALPSGQSPMPLDASSVDEITYGSNERQLGGVVGGLIFLLCVAYVCFHLYALNIDPVETWAYRLIHVAGGLLIGFLLLGASSRFNEGEISKPLLVAAVFSTLISVFVLGVVVALSARDFLGLSGEFYTQLSNQLLVVTWVALIGNLVCSYLYRGKRKSLSGPDLGLGLLAVAVALYILSGLPRWRMMAGTVMVGELDLVFSAVGVVLILELTRRVAGLALVAITAVFIGYAFVGPWLPGILEHQGYSAARFFSYLQTDNGVLGPTVAVSSTYIVLFIAFAAFLQRSRVGEYFVTFAFALAGRSRGGPAKVAVFASGLMGMINGTSAGNVVSTGSLTIPLMKRVGYSGRSAGSIEAAASTGGQIAPPIMGAGAFIMAEVTGIAYSDIAIAAIIPALMYFLSIYFMVDLEAQKNGMRGMRKDELPALRPLLARIYMFVPILILIGALFMGYSVIRAGTLSLIAAAMVSWLTPHWMGPKAILEALALAARMVIPLVAVCACAGLVVGVIALTGVGARFAAMLLTVADNSEFLALVFAMLLSIVLGMGMPTTAAYAVAAAVIAPGLQKIGIDPLVAHFFVFYYAVISAITPPVALASYAAAAIANTDPLKTSFTSFKFGLAAFVVPFLFFYSPSILMQGEWIDVARVIVTAAIGIYLLSAAVQGWLRGRLSVLFRLLAMVSGLAMMAGGWVTDLVGIVLALGIVIIQVSHERRELNVQIGS